MPDALTFTLRADGVVLADSWPAEIEVTTLLLGITDEDLMRLDGDELVISAANGTALYRVTGRRPDCDTIVAELVSVRGAS